MAPSPPRQRPTRRQLEFLRAYVAAGSIAAAAHELGISETTARQHHSGLYQRAGLSNAAQAAYWLGTQRLELARPRPIRTSVRGVTGSDILLNHGRQLQRGDAYRRFRARCPGR